MANFLFYRYHFVPAEEPDLFAQEERADASRDESLINVFVAKVYGLYVRYY